MFGGFKWWSSRCPSVVELTNRSAQLHQEILSSSEKEWTTETENNLMVLSDIILSGNNWRRHSQKVTCCVVQIRRKSTVTEKRLVFTRGGRWKEGVTVTPQEMGWWNSSVTVTQTYPHVMIHRTVHSTFSKAKNYCVKTEKINKQKTYTELTSDLRIQISGQVGPVASGLYNQLPVILVSHSGIKLGISIKV